MHMYFFAYLSSSSVCLFFDRMEIPTQPSLHTTYYVLSQLDSVSESNLGSISDSNNWDILVFERQVFEIKVIETQIFEKQVFDIKDKHRSALCLF